MKRNRSDLVPLFYGGILAGYDRPLHLLAPERAALRERHRRRAPGCDALNPWDLYLYTAGRTPEAWADALMAAHYFQRSPRWVMRSIPVNQ